ncbi:carbohydrate ABC transporter permease [Deinococcus cellulosilyticus]|uniref:sn-glycerol-3-phosphate transport system permease protein UgpE n=1 Tax=Deinococcus cellulosilyticus (strain DSM 18568 / NBRC 106333 / KACC 11606 / 5516J-15) TaxID=1223518 RepID=A0A511N8E9_DEIC1|nr:carbohydrate ABC transporter permease [Deinococcus cellulosilyticus]GEM49100.1 sn-glycerol-3-phosphate transport system permease protein UgpE [Deinococcus cellulosilyticus NBRC 106333 = KACC 11606]
MGLTASTTNHTSRKTSKTVGALLTYLVLLFFSFLFVFPVLFMVVSSFKDTPGIFSDLRSLRAFLPVGNVSLENFQYIFERGNILLYFKNSLIVSGVTVVLSVLVNSMAAFALARLRWKGRGVLLGFVISLMIVPFEAIAIPLLLLVSKFPALQIGPDGIHLTGTWLNSYTVQIVPFIGSAFNIFLFYQFFLDIPRELDEAASIDGATPWQIYWKIVMPIARPVIATCAILGFLGMWNQYLWPIMTVQGASARPLQPGIQEFFGRTTQWGQVLAYTSLITLPMLLVFLTFQKWFVKSVATNGLKG